MDTHPLWELLTTIKAHTFVDLTHVLTTYNPHAADMPNASIEKLYDMKKDGFRAHTYTFAGQWSTHCDPPSHLIADGRSIDEILPSEMMAPLVVIDVRDRVEVVSDYVLTEQDILLWEEAHGLVPDGAFVVMQSGWSTRWDSPLEFYNADSSGIRHTPGWSIDAVDFLCTQRNIVGIGHETLDTDPGVLVANDCLDAEVAILGHGKYQIEALRLIEDVPPAGSIIVVSFAKPKAGSGFPARVFAIVP